jgi:hypothetical protein
LKAYTVDEELFRALQPFEVTTYLQTAGWTRVDEWEKGSTWSRQADGRERVVDVPNDRRFSDYPMLISDTVAAIAEVEGRTVMDVFTDLSEISCDVVRVRVQSSQTATGRISLPQAERLVHGARDMMTAAACAAIEPRPVYDFRREGAARQYVSDRVFLGQSQRGSYVVAVLSEVPLTLALDDRPFERRVTTRLLAALDAVKAAVVESRQARGDVTVFQTYVASGVSANLCGAIAEMSPGQPDGVVQVGFSWSPVHRQTELERRSLSFDRRDAEVIREAVQALIELSPLANYEVVGLIVKCERSRPDQPGMVTISTIIDDQLSTVTTRLAGDAYQFALEAHGLGRRVRLVGTRRKRGRAADYELLDSSIGYAG